MTQLLHVSSAAIKETDDGNVCTITLGAVSAHAGELIPLVGEQVILKTPGQKGRQFGGALSVLQVKDGKHGPEVTCKVVGATLLNGLVGTNVEIEAAQIALFVPAQQPQGLGHTPDHIHCPACAPVKMGESVIVPVLQRELAKAQAGPAVGTATNVDSTEGKYTTTGAPPVSPDLEDF